ncbi:hypothetical protein [Pseudanabaena sp. UWO310]|uniref:hypothetical protein n=1 Tax=Pseudanabaena sp. UWO310 TaxID=2480795 RepID=UPI0011611A65|nr:hypothetical protein [Pseudanabaena sp. UWO310]TYQ23965.1 hypothetical protein PseudUWO310_21400 [Pseudanabaena sp. UWO310]
MQRTNLNFGLKSGLRSGFNFKVSVKAIVLMLLAIATFTLVVFQIPQGLYSQTIPADLISKYNLAVADAKVAELDEVSQDLVAITKDNKFLIWQNKTAPKDKLLVATWTNYTGYDNQVGQPITTSRQTWVTVAPELQNFCKEKLKDVTNQSDRTLRLEQLLGLPPNNGKTRFVEFWVSPENLFRPSADAEITDRTAFGEFTQIPPSPDATIKLSYLQWFEKLRSQSYNATGGYPWTRMGYTYDWGNPKSEIGLSEFVIDTGAAIEVKSVQTTDKYCVS